MRSPFGEETMSQSDEHLQKPAIDRMRSAGLDVEEKAYGFRLVYRSPSTEYVGECGSEHNGSISIAINNGTPPNRWFFRFSMSEMADYLIAADEEAQSGNRDFLTTLEAIDSRYDHDRLEQRLREAYPELPWD
jgi:hypothetical protein